jgi:hypothetical protein
VILTILPKTTAGTARLCSYILGHDLSQCFDRSFLGFSFLIYVNCLLTSYICDGHGPV